MSSKCVVTCTMLPPHNNKNITVLQKIKNGNCELLKDKSSVISKDKNLFKSYIDSSNNIPTFNRFANVNNKIFSDSIVKGIRIREINRFITNGNGRISGFPGATSNSFSIIWM